MEKHVLGYTESVQIETIQHEKACSYRGSDRCWVTLHELSVSLS